MRQPLTAAAFLFLSVACTTESTRPLLPTESSLARAGANAKPSTTPLQTTVDDTYPGARLHSDGGAYVNGACGVSDLLAGGSQLRTDANWNKKLGCIKRYLTVQMPSWSAPAAANAMYFPDLTTAATGGRTRGQLTVGLSQCLMVRFGWTPNDNADSVSYSYDIPTRSWTVTSSGRGTCWVGDGHGGQYPTGENAVVPFRVTITIR